MAKVLRMRMPESDSLVVHDLNTTVTQQFMDETSWAKASTAVAETPKELAEQSVCSLLSLRMLSTLLS